MIKQLGHVCLLTTDLAATEAFYCRGLGLQKAFDFEKEGRWYGFYLKMANETYIEVFEGNPGKPGNIIHLALEVEDIDVAISSLREREIAVTDKKEGTDGNLQAWLEDPNGVKIELMQYLPGNSQTTGRTAMVNW